QLRIGQYAPDPPRACFCGGPGLATTQTEGVMTGGERSKTRALSRGKLQLWLANRILFAMLQRTLPARFIAPYLPTKTDKLPSGSQWLHEIKHDGFRVIARKNGAQVRLYSRPGNDLTHRFPLIVDALSRLRSRSCIIDGEAVACDDNGVASFDLVRHQRANESIFLYAFDLIELNGDFSGATRWRAARPRLR